MGALELLKPLITPEVRKLADQRLLFGESLIKKGNASLGKRRGTVKVALLVVHAMNPFEKFGVEEEALLRGISSDTLLRNKNELKKL